MSFYTISAFTKQTAAGVITVPNINDAENIVIHVAADVATTATIKFLGSIQKAVPNFGGAQSSTNQWDYIAFRELRSANLITGATGVTVTATTHHRLYELECDSLTHIGIEMTTVSGDGVVFTVLAANPASGV